MDSFLSQLNKPLHLTTSWFYCDPLLHSLHPSSIICFLSLEVPKRDERSKEKLGKRILPEK